MFLILFKLNYYFSILQSNESTAAEVGEYIVYPFSNNISNLLICIVKHDVNEVDENEEEDIEIKSMSEENSKKSIHVKFVLII